MIVKSKVKYIQSLSHKKQREQDGVFIVEGPKIINELLNESPFELVELFATSAWLAHNPSASHLPLTEIDEITLSRISSLTTPNQVLGIFRMRELQPFAPGERLSLLLSGIQDPGNLGTIIRCADWFGVENIVCSEDSVDVYNHKTIQATMGSIGRVNVFYANLRTIIEDHSNVPVYATLLAGDDIKSIEKPATAMILVGNESRGIDEDLLQLPHRKITITRKGKAESLNAAIATAIVLHAFAG